MTVDDEQDEVAKRTPQHLDIDGTPGHRIHDNVAEPGFDIGVASRVTSRSALVVAATDPPQRRRLPMWAVAVAALLVGWMLGASLGSSGSDSSTALDAPAQSATTAPVEGVVVESAATSGLSPSGLAGLAIPDARLVYAKQSDVGPSASAITVIDASGATTVVLADGLADSPPGGRIGRSVLTSGTLVFSVVGRQASVVDAATADAAVVLAEADLLLAGTGSGNLWAVLSASRTVRLIDVGSRSVRATYDLSAVGAPLGSYDGGLIVAPDIELFGPFALWSPARGIERLWSVDERAVFIDAAGSTIVIHTSQGLASYNAVTGSLTQLDRRLSDGAQAWSTVSPDGARLAITERPTSTGSATIEVVDLISGDTSDQFEVTAAATLRWVAKDQLLHMAASNSRQVQLRNIELGFDTSLSEADPTMVWMVLTD